MCQRSPRRCVEIHRAFGNVVVFGSGWHEAQRACIQSSHGVLFVVAAVHASNRLGDMVTVVADGYLRRVASPDMMGPVAMVVVGTRGRLLTYMSVLLPVRYSSVLFLSLPSLPAWSMTRTNEPESQSTVAGCCPPWLCSWISPKCLPDVLGQPCTCTHLHCFTSGNKADTLSGLAIASVNKTPLVGVTVTWAKGESRVCGGYGTTSPPDSVDSEWSNVIEWVACVCQTTVPSLYLPCFM